MKITIKKGVVSVLSSRTRLVLTTVLLLSLLAVPALGNEFRIERPVLMTSVGQSSDIAMANVLLNDRFDLGFAVEEQATVEDLDGIKTLILVVGASAKGLGDAGLDADQEYERVAALIAAAKEQDMSIVALHTGGMARRGRLSDDYVSQSVLAADYTIIVATGNEDGYFDTLTETAGTPLVQVERIVDVADETLALLKDE